MSRPRSAVGTRGVQQDEVRTDARLKTQGVSGLYRPRNLKPGSLLFQNPDPSRREFPALESGFRQQGGDLTGLDPPPGTHVQDGALLPEASDDSAHHHGRFPLRGGRSFIVPGKGRRVNGRSQANGIRK
ncbi:hypothetical protein SDC9_179394 [bioreactor metagenome]|uniref:Uncharacterized protein n=1 Tax=bioreactor metagenome TaxID=1076179 RepID=A0A645H1P5_9ZZZZ